MTKVDIISGFLGAGKTTLIKKLVKEVFAGQQIVLIENEFGEIGIDGGFLKDAGINITEMNSGCICCSLVGDFGKALKEVTAQFHPDRIIIEPSGVGKLSDVRKAVEDASEEAGLVLNGLVTVADASKIKMYMKNFGEFYNNQVEHAGAIILSRTQSLSEEKQLKAMEMIREKNPKAVVITTPWDQLTGQQILEAIEGTNSLAKELLEEEHHHHDHDEECCREGHHHHDHDGECGHEGHHHHEHDGEHSHDHHHDHDGECGHENHHEHDGECGHEDHHHDHDGECGHEGHHHHEHDGECGHEGHHHHEHDGECGHEDHHHHDHDGECGHENHHEHDGECGHEHHHDHDGEHGHDHHHDHDGEHGHDHHHDHDGECGHEHHHHHHDGECGCGHDHHHHHADEVFTSWGRETPRKYTKEELDHILEKLSESAEFGIVLRAKGMLPCADGSWLHFDMVPGEYEIRNGSADYTGRLCVIGSQMNEEKLEKLFLL